MGRASARPGRSPRSMKTARTSRPYRTMKSRPFRPTATTLTGSCCSTMNCPVVRFMLALSPPQSPLSGVMWTTDVWLTSRFWSSGWMSSASTGCAARSARTPWSFSAYGRPASVSCCARRILEAAIICIALVILAVFWTLRMRRRICRILAIVSVYHTLHSTAPPLGYQSSALQTIVIPNPRSCI